MQMATKRISISLVFIFICQLVTLGQTKYCNSGDFVYGENGIIDELITCSLGKLSDLDLTPTSKELPRSTARAPSDQNFISSASVISSRLSGLWTAKRPSHVQSGWRCEPNRTVLNAIIQLGGLSMNTVERINLPHYSTQPKLSAHKPCKTFDLPVWMCRQTNPIYRTVTTWTNRAYFNLTLAQSYPNNRPSIEHFELVFTCPETFKQKISYSPSAASVLSTLMHTFGSPDLSTVTSQAGNPGPSATSTPDKPAGKWVGNPISHLAFSTVQSGKSPVSPPYHDAVNSITDKVTEALAKSLQDCIESIDSDLSLMNDHSSFEADQFIELSHGDSRPDAGNECSNRLWIKNRLELASQASGLALLDEPRSVQRRHQGSSKSHSKRNQKVLLGYPSDTNELLDPFGYYYSNIDRMIDDK